jgi:hypothetical protein
MWTTTLLAKHAQEHCEENGHPCLKHLSRGTVSKILSANMIKPHKITYYLERLDPLLAIFRWKYKIDTIEPLAK